MEALDPVGYRAWFETPLGRIVNADEKRLLLDLGRLRSGERVLDVGCGDGNFTEEAARATGAAVGVDLSPEMIRAAAARLKEFADVKWVEGDAMSLPFPHKSFDVVLAVTVLCLGVAPEAVLREAYRVLSPGGRLVVGELGRWSTWAANRAAGSLFGSTTWQGSRFFSLGELSRLLKRAGFSNLRTGGAVFYPPAFRLAMLRPMRSIERVGRRLTPGLGAFLTVTGVRGLELQREGPEISG